MICPPCKNEAERRLAYVLRWGYEDGTIRIGDLIESGWIAGHKHCTGCECHHRIAKLDDYERWGLL